MLALTLLHEYASDEVVFSRLLSLKTHLFLIQFFESKSTSLANREIISHIFTEWVNVRFRSPFSSQLFPREIPYSLAISLTFVASQSSNPFCACCLHLLLHLLIHHTRLVISCDGVSVLLRGCVEIQDDSLLQSSLLACLFLLNTPTYRQPMILLDLQYVMEPFIADPIRSDSSFYYIANLAVLTIMRSWNGLLIFGSDFDGFSNYMSILAARGEENTMLAN